MSKRNHSTVSNGNLSVITIDSNGKTNAIEVISDNGFEDINPDAGFYDENKIYKKGGKFFMFGGWNVKKIKGKSTFPSLNMEEINC